MQIEIGSEQYQQS